MKLIIQKWGHSAAIKLPESMLEQLGSKIGDSIDLKVLAGAATLRIAKPKYKLADLLAEMPNGLPIVDGWDEMTPVGKEIY